MPEQGVVLEHHADPALLGGNLGDVSTGEQHSTGVEGFEAGEGPQQGGLATTAGAHEGDEFTVTDLEIDTVEDVSMTEATS